ncbi:MAG: proton-conducting transporter membrane subunit, partial [Candidatus Limnocylindria bacterium]
MSVVAAIAILALAAAAAFGIRKRLALVGPLAAGALVVALALVAVSAPETSATLLEIPFRLTALGRLAALILLGILLLLVLDVVLVEPAYNFFPTACGVGAAALAVLTLTAPLAIYCALLVGLLLPVGSFTFQVERNRSVEAATRHFGFVALGGSLGLAALALGASLPKDHATTTFVLLVVILVVAFALKLAAIPFHTHAAFLVAEAPVAALALYFGVLVPATFIAFAEILTLSGLLPAIGQLQKVQDLLLAIGFVSAIGGALLASGADDLRRLVAYAVISNLGAALVGMATLSGAGIV